MLIRGGAYSRGRLFNFAGCRRQKAEVVGKGKREIGLVVPAKYTAMTNDKKFAEILLEKLEEKKKIVDINIFDSLLKKLPIYET